MNCVYASLPLKKDGSVDIVEIKEGEFVTPFVFLNVNAADGGFIQVDKKTIFSSLEAPAKGYKKSLKVSTLPLWKEGRSLFFYLKVKGLYGRGYLEPTSTVPFYDKNRTLSFRFALYFEYNPEGGRLFGPCRAHNW